MPNPEGPRRSPIKVSLRFAPNPAPRGKSKPLPTQPRRYAERLDSRTLILGLLVVLLITIAGTLGLWLMDARQEAANLRRDLKTVEKLRLKDRERARWMEGESEEMR